ncbi:hypothetical protein QN344_07570, partial [Mucilaginibacter sp. 5B2]|nr:hypothetical protein [Mucilaginibacter sp. 5B2]
TLSSLSDKRNLIGEGQQPQVSIDNKGLFGLYSDLPTRYFVLFQPIMADRSPSPYSLPNYPKYTWVWQEARN